ncbi:DNA-3-methyladenine glycosylase I [Aliidiomarina halalkaliphila]|uniref:DNA-3-methyladenine glycosylase I n=1 Tax=Aliidiomarina halalkaliphila TaxID=2593535 RepID=A0A552X001_9GAMM|nr:DNA-3-methyladenine glycosylase I [Aliidiomarina halalkaliphila]TRW48392.1 DNA-3-methyladenine glycosylase I [Aliidiomarina halalkaliphila]
MKFEIFYQRALERKGGLQKVSERLPYVATADELRALGDDRYLATITKCVFRAGFVWRIIENKWPGFEEAFSGFLPLYWQQVPPERLEALGRDERIVRNMQKINTVPQNAFMIVEVAERYGSFGEFLAQWPSHDQVGLLLWLKKNGSRLGGASAQYFLRMVGWDGFILSSDVTAALVNHNLLDANPTSQKGLKQAQKVFNQWHEETGLPYAHLSKILSFTLDAR